MRTRKVKRKCAVCEKEFESKEYTIRKGSLKGIDVIDAYCSDKCRNIIKTKINNNFLFFLLFYKERRKTKVFNY